MDIPPEWSEVIEENMAKVRIPQKHHEIHKDECVYSFDTPESDQGLYVCLSSFWGFGHHHVENYASLTGNRLYLHIKRIKHKVIKEVTNESPKNKVTRLAIGVDGGFNSETNIQEYEIEETQSFVIIPGFHKIPLPNDKLPAVIIASINEINNAESAIKKAQLSALTGTWDGEVRNVSRHADNLPQLNNGKKIPPRGWRCEVSDCNKTENLWLNLSDGSILCGRKFFDGSGGNGHALEHYQKQKHPLAVKLGTITADCNADVFSYDEDEMVIDPKLGEHLAHWGINFSIMEKTEKTMAEMEIDLNQKIEWSALTEMGTKLEPIYGPGYTGMINLGNSCYLNSIMQVLFEIPSFQERYKSKAKSYFQSSNDPANDFNVQMAKLCDGLFSGNYSKSESEENLIDQVGIRPQMFQMLVGKGHREFSTKRQQDAQEFFLHIINLMERHSLNEQNPAESFKFQVEDKVICSETGMVRYTHRFEYCLPLPIPMEAAMNIDEIYNYEEKKKAAEKEGRQLLDEEMVRPKILIEDCLRSFAQPEIIDKFYSSAVNKVIPAQKITRLSSFPEYLVIQLKKFKLNDDWKPMKLDVSVDMPFELDLSCLKTLGKQLGEKYLPDTEDTETAPKAPQVDEAVVNQLIEMGFHQNACKRAVIASGNSGNEAALNWLMEHLEDPNLNNPIEEQGGQMNSNIAVNLEAQEQIMAMGFSAEAAAKSLRATDNNVERAMDWIFSHPDEASGLGGNETQGHGHGHDQRNQNNVDLSALNNGPPNYKLFGFVSHMGQSTNVGHYVCHILKNGKWVIFNDNKVALSENLPRDLGYLYFYKRV